MDKPQTIPISSWSTEVKHLMSNTVVLLNNNYGKFDVVDYTSVLLGFLVSDDPVSKWFQSYITSKKFKNNEIVIDLHKSKEMPINAVAKMRTEIKNKGIPPIESDTYLESLNFSSSENAILSEAYNYAMNSNSQLEIRHIMGAYIYLENKFHDEQLRELGFVKEDWSKEFNKLMFQTCKEEITLWDDLHAKVMGSKQSLQYFEEREKEQGNLANSLSSDKWTLNDSLGYWIYAVAVYHFLIHKNTSAPATISISAPWGGGKTSLMKMIQHRLDPLRVQKTKDNESDDSQSKTIIKDLVDEMAELFVPPKWIELIKLIEAKNKKT